MSNQELQDAYAELADHTAYCEWLSARASQTEAHRQELAQATMLRCEAEMKIDILMELVEDANCLSSEGETK